MSVSGKNGRKIGALNIRIKTKKQSLQLRVTCISWCIDLLTSVLTYWSSRTTTRAGLSKTHINSFLLQNVQCLLFPDPSSPRVGRQGLQGVELPFIHSLQPFSGKWVQLQKTNFKHLQYFPWVDCCREMLKFVIKNILSHIHIKLLLNYNNILRDRAHNHVTKQR